MLYEKECVESRGGGSFFGFWLFATVCIHWDAKFTQTSCFCCAAVFHVDKKRCVRLTAWILIGVIFHPCWFSLMLMKDLCTLPAWISTKCPEVVVLGEGIILTAASFVSIMHCLGFHARLRTMFRAANVQCTWKIDLQGAWSPQLAPVWG